LRDDDGVPPLVDAAELSAMLESGTPPSLLDVRWRAGDPDGHAHYLEGHVPSAVFVDLDRDLASPPGDGSRGRHPLPDVAAFEAAMRRAGVTSQRTVMVYDDAGSTSAARGWWLLAWAGHEDVRVLDGGLGAWRAAGGRLEDGEIEAAAGDFVARPGAREVLDADGAAALARDAVLLDARAAARFRGEEELFDPVAGHIPGARSAPTAENLDADGRFLLTEALMERFAKLGVQPGTRVGAYCGSGVTAAHELLALEVAGVEGGALYVGSWSEWVADRRRPVSVGASG
jgi:thiosulfate/3-mercaptopyruvate sulfurtransferase